MRRWVKFSGLLAILMAAPYLTEAKDSAGYGGQGKSKKPVFHNGITQEGVTVEARLLSGQEIKSVFGVDLLRENIQPVVIKIKNDSAQTVQFFRANLNVEALPAAEAAKAAFENPIVVGGGLIKRGMGAVGRVIFPKKKTPEEKPITNSELQATFVREEMPEGDIAPDSFVQGFVFIRPLTKEQNLSIKLTPLAGTQAFAFDIPKSN